MSARYVCVYTRRCAFQRIIYVVRMMGGTTYWTRSSGAAQALRSRVYDKETRGQQDGCLTNSPIVVVYNPFALDDTQCGVVVAVGTHTMAINVRDASRYNEVQRPAA